MRRQVFVYLGILAFLFLATSAVILYGRGYRFGFGKEGPQFSDTGLLVATSTPDGAQVFINGHLTTATNNTINLSPGDYDVKIFKDGYFPWEKHISVQKEVVSKAEALLFPKALKIENITDTGVNNPAVDPSHTKLAFTVASQSARQNGVYILNLADQSILTLQSGANQIADDTVAPLSTATLTWSPDGQNILASVPNASGKPTMYLLNAGGFNQNPQDVTETLDNVKATWDKQIAEKEKSQFGTLKPTLAKFLKENAKIIAWSPDETKILYSATTSATMPQIIKPALIGTDSTPEQRTLEPKSVYVYDTKEDKNFLLVSADKNPDNYKLTWYPDSTHLISVHDKKIDMVEYDGMNPTTVYAGPFIDSDVFPWTTATKIVILTNLNNSNAAPDLYTIELQ